MKSDHGTKLKRLKSRAFLEKHDEAKAADTVKAADTETAKKMIEEHLEEVEESRKHLRRAKSVAQEKSKKRQNKRRQELIGAALHSHFGGMTTEALVAELDPDADGKISLDEMHAKLQNISFAGGRTISMEDCRVIIGNFDQDGDGNVTVDEWVAGFHAMERASEGRVLRIASASRDIGLHLGLGEEVSVPV